MARHVDVEIKAIKAEDAADVSLFVRQNGLLARLRLRVNILGQFQLELHRNGDGTIYDGNIFNEKDPLLSRRDVKEE